MRRDRNSREHTSRAAGASRQLGRTAHPVHLGQRGTKFLLIWLVITIVVCIVDYVVPAYFTRVTGGSKAAGRGAIVGLIIGMFVPPVGIILGTLGGAFLAEYLVAQKGGWDSARSALGALLGFFFGTGIKLIASGLMMYYIIVFIK